MKNTIKNTKNNKKQHSFYSIFLVFFEPGTLLFGEKSFFLRL